MLRNITIWQEKIKINEWLVARLSYVVAPQKGLKID